MHTEEHHRTISIVEIAVGATAIAAVAAASAVAVPATQTVRQVLILAVAVGVLAARFSRWPAAVTTAVIATMILPLWLAPDEPAMAGGATAWGSTPLFAFALMVGRGYRTLAHANAHSHPAAGDDTDRGAARPSLFIWTDRLTANPGGDKLDER